jgi:hypothetical protein
MQGLGFTAGRAGGRAGDPSEVIPGGAGELPTGEAREPAVRYGGTNIDNSSDKWQLLSDGDPGNGIWERARTMLKPLKTQRKLYLIRRKVGTAGSIFLDRLPLLCEDKAPFICRSGRPVSPCTIQFFCPGLKPGGARNGDTGARVPSSARIGSQHVSGRDGAFRAFCFDPSPPDSKHLSPCVSTCIIPCQAPFDYWPNRIMAGSATRQKRREVKGCSPVAHHVGLFLSSPHLFSAPPGGNYGQEKSAETSTHNHPARETTAPGKNVYAGSRSASGTGTGRGYCPGGFGSGARFGRPFAADHCRPVPVAASVPVYPAPYGRFRKDSRTDYPGCSGSLPPAHRRSVVSGTGGRCGQ